MKRQLLIVGILFSCFVISQGATVPLYQNWADTSTSGIWAQDSIAYDDVLQLQSDIYLSPAYRCLALTSVRLADSNITIDGNNFTVHFDTAQPPALDNPNFETADTDTNYAQNWDFTDADSTFREAGDTVSGAYPPVHRGTYSCAVHLPCDSQKIITDNAKAFAANIDWVVGVHIFNKIDADVRFHIRGVAPDGSYDFWRYYDVGVMSRHWVYLWLDLGDADSLRNYKFQIMVQGTGSGSEGEKVYFDDLRATTDRYHGIGLRPDTLAKPLAYTGGLKDMPTNVLVGAVPYMGDGYPTPSNHTLASHNLTVQDLTVEAGAGHALFSCGIIAGSHRAAVKNCRVTTKGIGSANFFSYYCDFDTITGSNMWLIDGQEISRDKFINGNINLYGDDFNGGDGWLVQSCTLGGSSHAAIYARTNCDGTDDAVDDNPLGTIRDCYIYTNAYYTNSFGVNIYDQYACNVINNYIYGYDGSDTLCGSGIHLEVMDTPCYNTRARIDSNVIVSAWLPRNQETAGYSLAYGIQLEGAHKLDVTNNFCTVYVNTDANKACWAAAFRFNWDDAYDDIRIANNTFAAFALDDAEKCYPVWFSFSDGHYDYDTEDVSFDSNIIVGNGNWLGQVAYIDTLWEWHGCTFEFDTLAGSAPTPSWQTFFVGKTTNDSRVDRLRFVDPQFPDDGVSEATFDSAYFYVAAGSASADTNVLYFVGYIDTIMVLDSLANPVNNASVYWVNTDGDTVETGATNASGIYVAYIDHYREEADATTPDRDLSRHYFNDYIISVAFAAFSDVDTVTVTQNDSFTLTIGTTVAQKRLLLRSN